MFWKAEYEFSSFEIQRISLKIIAAKMKLSFIFWKLNHLLWTNAVYKYFGYVLLVY